MVQDGGWRDGALAIVPRGGHKRRLAGLLLVLLLSSGWSTGLAENDRRLLSGPYPDVASALARCRAAATGLSSPRIVPVDDASPPPLPLGGMTPLQRQQVLTAVQSGGYHQWADASQQSRRLESAGIDSLMIAPGVENGFALRTGAFREECTVYPPIRLGYSFIYTVPLERAASDPDTTRLSEGEEVPVAPSRFAGPAADSKGVMIGSQPGPVPEATEQAPGAANNPRLVVDPIWIEAGALVDGLQVGDLIVGRRAVFHPYGFAEPEGELPENWRPPLEFPALPWLVAAPEQAVD